MASFEELFEKANSIKRWWITRSRPLYYFLAYKAAWWTPDDLLSPSQKLVLDFKYARRPWFQEAQDKVLDMVCNFLEENFPSKDYVFAFVPASTKIWNDIRFWNFSKRLSERLWIENWFDYIQIFKDREAKHNWNRNVKFSDYITIDKRFMGKNIIIFDDLVTYWRNIYALWDRLAWDAIKWHPFLALTLWRTIAWYMDKYLLYETTKQVEKKVYASNKIPIEELKKIRDEDNDNQELYQYLKSIDMFPGSREEWKEAYLTDDTLRTLAKYKPLNSDEFEKIEGFSSAHIFIQIGWVVKYIRQYYEKKYKENK